MSDFKVAKGPCTFGVDDSLWNPFPVEMSQFVDKNVVLKQNRTSRAHGHGIGFVSYWTACPGGQGAGGSNGLAEIFHLVRGFVSVIGHLASSDVNNGL